MSQITLENHCIYYYNNPAGYIQEAQAIVDTMFQRDDLCQWLQHQNLKPQWEDGVMERLIQGQIPLGEQAPTQKAVRIWQLNADVDVRMKFISLEELQRHFGPPDPQNYHTVYDGAMGINDLEDIYTLCNIHHPQGYTGHSLSMGDVVELYDDTGSQFFYCNRMGFDAIAFTKPQQNQTMSMSL
ncbi:YodL domain-containing protein [Bengtsoniella intestinalis]|uniref:YodL domain-containing protein n=1 Tax=Bengtsoniella intestinalis TaxID=3073143 RepID=UPI00391F9251